MARKITTGRNSSNGPKPAGPKPAGIDPPLSRPSIRTGEVRPSASQPEELGQFLILRANRLVEQEGYGDALESIDEAIGIWRRLTAARPDAARPTLALALGVKGSILGTMARPADAADSLLQALRTVKPSLEKTPVALSPLAASIFKDYLANVDAAGIQPDHALLEPIAALLEKAGYKTDDEAEEVGPGFDPDRPRPDAAEPEKLSAYLIALSRHLSGLGNHTAALEAIDEAVDLWRPLLETKKGVATMGLALALGLKGDVERELTLPAEAAVSFAEGLALITPAFVERPQVFLTLATALFRDYLTSVEEAGLEVDEDLILPAFEVLRDMGMIAVDEDEDEEDEEDDADNEAPSGRR